MEFFIYEKSIFLIFFLFLILSISSVCASDDFNDMGYDNLSLDNSDIALNTYGDSLLTSQYDDYIAVNESVSVSASNVTKYFGGSERFNVYISDNENNSISNKSVIISINGVDYSRTTNSDGVASIGLNLMAGEYPVIVSCGNNVVNSNVVILSTVNGSDIVKMEKNDTQYYAAFLDSQGNPLANGTDVRFNINGVFYDRKVNGGLAKLNINLNPGDYIITAMNLVTGDRNSNTISVISKLIENSDVTKYYKNNTQYTLKVLNNTGGVAPAGESVTFNINGVLYNRLTNGSGYCRLNINLNPGDYIITAQYNGSVVSNKIKVLPILSASDLTKLYATPGKFAATLLDGKGKLYSNQTVRFNINGVFYNRTTDNNGQAMLNINLHPGEYIITSMFNGASISNKVVVDPILISIFDISRAANELNAYYEKYNKFPNTIKAPVHAFTMPEFFYLMSQAIYQLGNSNTNDVTVISGVSAPSSPTGDTIDSKDLKTFVKVAQNVANYIKTNNKAPNYASSDVGKIIYSELVDSFSRILAFYKTNKRLPSYVTISYGSSSSSSTTGSGSGLNEKCTETSLDKYLKATTNCQVGAAAIKSIVSSVTKGLTSDLAKAKAIFNYVRDTLSYSFYYNTKYGATGALSAKKGNCVDHSHLLVAMFRTAGLEARYVHGTCTFSSGSTYGHVWTQVLVNGQWYVADATSSKNSLGSVSNWNTKSFTLKGIYAQIDF